MNPATVVNKNREHLSIQQISCDAVAHETSQGIPDWSLQKRISMRIASKDRFVDMMAEANFCRFHVVI